MSDETKEELEGCLSFPGIKIPVKRLLTIHAYWSDTYGEIHDQFLNNFTARMFQHECEHLDGTTFLRNINEKEAFKIHTIMRKAKGGF
jgi:peptide deformylase